MAQFKRLKQKEFLECSGAKCPECGAIRNKRIKSAIGGKLVIIHKECQFCGVKYKVIYRMTRYILDKEKPTQ